MGSCLLNQKQLDAIVLNLSDSGLNYIDVDQDLTDSKEKLLRVYGYDLKTKLVSCLYLMDNLYNTLESCLYDTAEVFFYKNIEKNKELSLEMSAHIIELDDIRYKYVTKLLQSQIVLKYFSKKHFDVSVDVLGRNINNRDDINIMINYLDTRSYAQINVQKAVDDYRILSGVLGVGLLLSTSVGYIRYDKLSSSFMNYKNNMENEISICDIKLKLASRELEYVNNENNILKKTLLDKNDKREDKYEVLRIFDLYKKMNSQMIAELLKKNDQNLTKYKKMYTDAKKLYKDARNTGEIQKLVDAYKIVRIMSCAESNLVKAYSYKAFYNIYQASRVLEISSKYKSEQDQIVYMQKKIEREIWNNFYSMSHDISGVSFEGKK